MAVDRIELKRLQRTGNSNRHAKPVRLDQVQSPPKPQSTFRRSMIPGTSTIEQRLSTAGVSRSRRPPSGRLGRPGLDELHIALALAARATFVLTY